MWPVIVLLAGPVVAGLFSLVVQRARILHLVNLFTMLALAVAETVLTRQVLAEGSVTTFERRRLRGCALGFYSGHHYRRRPVLLALHVVVHG